MMHNQRELIEKYLLPALGLLYPIQEYIFDRILQICRFQRVTKYQEVEMPGRGDEGRAWLFIDGFSHSYYYCPNKNSNRGTRIWKKRELIFFTKSLQDNEYRSNYIEVLEPGTMISISYAALSTLINEFPQIKNQINHISTNNEQYYLNHSLLLIKPPLERVAQFTSENSAFIHCTSQEIQSSHVNLTRKGYIAQLNKLKK